METFCIAPFVNFSTTTDGRVRLCCQAAPFKNVHVHDNDIEKIWQSEEYQIARNAFLDNQWPEQCSTCQQNRKKGIPARIDMENSRWKHLDWEELKKDPRIHCYDLRMGNTCNLKCVMCHPYNSSLWYNEMSQHPHMQTFEPHEGHKWALNDYLLDEIRANMHYAQMLYFSGGEPLLIKKHRELIDYCIEHGHSSHISLVYDTNGTCIDENWIKRWSHFKHVQINLSIDGGKDVVEYVRYPLKYEQITDALQVMKGSNCSVYLQFSIAAYNIFEVDDVLDLVDRYSCSGMNISIVYWPSFLSAHNLPDAEKRRAKELYAEHRVNTVRTFVQSLEFNGGNLDQLKSYFERIDVSRNLDYKKVFTWIE